MAKDNNRYTLNPFQRLLVGLLYGLCHLFAVMPRWVRYGLVQQTIFFILYHLLHYRRAVVDENLLYSFPERSDEERSSIAKRFYDFLAEQFVNTISVAGISTAKMRRNLTFPDKEHYIRSVEGRDVVLMGGHYGCWEYYNTIGLHDSNHIAVGVYHPLKSSVIDELFKRLRQCDNVELVPRDECLRYFLKNRGSQKHLALGLIADQNQYVHKDMKWFKFLNQDTLFAEGGEQLAMKLSVPVWFMGMRRRRRGEYELFCVELYDGVEPVERHEITERYVRQLEAMICECPELWLWSHRRWKYRKENIDKQ